MSYLLNGSGGGYAITTHLLYPLCHIYRESDHHALMVMEKTTPLSATFERTGWGRREEDKVVFAW
jgi:hypothetical protein